MAKETNRGANGCIAAEGLTAAARDAVERVALVADRAERDVRRAAARAAKRARKARKRAIRRASSTVGSLRSYVEDNPVAATGIAFAAGLVLAGLLRRKGD